MEKIKKLKIVDDKLVTSFCSYKSGLENYKNKFHLGLTIPSINEKKDSWDDIIQVSYDFLKDGNTDMQQYLRVIKSELLRTHALNKSRACNDSLKQFFMGAKLFTVYMMNKMQTEYEYQRKELIWAVNRKKYELTTHELITNRNMGEKSLEHEAIEHEFSQLKKELLELKLEDCSFSLTDYTEFEYKIKLPYTTVLAIDNMLHQAIHEAMQLKTNNLPPENSDTQLVLYTLIKKGSVSIEEHGSLCGFRTRISEIRKKMKENGVELISLPKKGKNRNGRTMRYKIHTFDPNPENVKILTNIYLKIKPEDEKEN